MAPLINPEVNAASSQAVLGKNRRMVAINSIIPVPTRMYASCSPINLVNKSTLSYAPVNLKYKVCSMIIAAKSFRKKIKYLFIFD